MIIDLSHHVSLQNINVHIDENALHEILNEVDLNKNGQVEIDEFLQVSVQSPVGEVKFVLQGCSLEAFYMVSVSASKTVTIS